MYSKRWNINKIYVEESHTSALLTFVWPPVILFEMSVQYSKAQNSTYKNNDRCKCSCFETLTTERVTQRRI